MQDSTSRTIPPPKKSITFRLDDAQRQALARIAASEHRTESQLIRMAIAAYVAQHEATGPYSAPVDAPEICHA